MQGLTISSIDNGSTHRNQVHEISKDNDSLNQLHDDLNEDEAKCLFQSGSKFSNKQAKQNGVKNSKKMANIY